VVTLSVSRNPQKVIRSYADKLADAPNLTGVLNMKMNRTLCGFAAALLLIFCSATLADSDPYATTIKIFRDAGQSSKFFAKSYGYAVFPTIGKGGIVIGAAHGSGHVYAQGKYVGDTSMTQVTAGLQMGGQAYSQIIFLQDKHTFDEFTNGNFEFGAEATAVAITAGASAGATTTGTSAGASGTEHNATTAGGFYKGMAIFTVVKGGLMYQATLGGQKFSYKAK
jgi:Las17-binding protein actin regulator